MPKPTHSTTRIDDHQITVDLVVDWEAIDEGVSINAVYMLLPNETIVGKQIVKTLDRINITDYGIDVAEVVEYLVENEIEGES